MLHLLGSQVSVPTHLAVSCFFSFHTARLSFYGAFLRGPISEPIVCATLLLDMAAFPGCNFTLSGHHEVTFDVAPPTKTTAEQRQPPAVSQRCATVSTV